MVTKIYLVRHCEAYGNHARVFQGASDSELSENGERQLAFLTEYFKGIEIDAAWSSPLKRTRLTAEACILNHNIPLNIDKRLIEINVGDFESRPFADMPVIDEAQAKNWMLSPENFHAPNGEKMTRVWARLSEVFLEKVKKNKGKTILFASHGCALRNLLCFVKYGQIEHLNDVDWCGNAAVSLIEENGDEFSVVYESDTTFLPDNLNGFAKLKWWKPENREKLLFE